STRRRNRTCPASGQTRRRNSGRRRPGCGGAWVRRRGDSRLGEGGSMPAGINVIARRGGKGAAAAAQHILTPPAPLPPLSELACRALPHCEPAWAKAEPRCPETAALWPPLPTLRFHMIGPRSDAGHQPAGLNLAPTPCDYVEMLTAGFQRPDLS